MSSIISSPIFSGIGAEDVAAEWGNITGALGDQTDLQNALNAKHDEFPVVFNSNGEAVIGSHNHITANASISLPAGTIVGEIIRMTRDIDAVVTLNGSVETSAGTDLLLEYDVNEEIVLRWNGTHWEI